MYITYYFSVSEMMFTCLSQNDGFLNASHFLWPSYFFEWSHHHYATCGIAKYSFSLQGFWLVITRVASVTVLLKSHHLISSLKKFSFAPSQVALMSNPSWQRDFFHHNYCFQTMEHILLKSSRFSNVDFHVKRWSCMYRVYTNN